jgi:hypothetical protein
MILSLLNLITSDNEEIIIHYQDKPYIIVTRKDAMNYNE